MSQRLLERLALGTTAGVIIGAIWFWTLQVGDVLEILRLAYG